MANTIDYYKTLGVSKTSTAEEIRKAYRKLARKYHPDVNKEPDAATKFAAVQQAYDTLSDAEKRKMYDQFGVGSSGRGGFKGNPRWSQQGGNVNFADIFGEAFGGGNSPFGNTAPTKGDDIFEILTVTFMTALRGGSEEIQINNSSVTVKIPAGIESGQKLRIKGKGNSGFNGGSAGDVLVTVNVGNHPQYRREGLDVEIDVPINIAEAALGLKVELPLPLGGNVEVSIPPGVSSGKRLRIKGKGCQASKKKTGDFYAIISIVAPEQMDDQVQLLVEELQHYLENPRTDSTIDDE